jgi:hypothetical protein
MKKNLTQPKTQALTSLIVIASLLLFSLAAVPKAFGTTNDTWTGGGAPDGYWHQHQLV